MTTIRANLIDSCEIYIPSVDAWETSICILNAKDNNINDCNNNNNNNATTPTPTPIQIPSMLQPLKDFSLCQFQEGKLSVIATGGLNDQGSVETQVMVFIDGAWKYVKQMNQTRKMHCSCRLPNGEIMVAGKFLFLMAMTAAATVVLIYIVIKIKIN